MPSLSNFKSYRHSVTLSALAGAATAGDIVVDTEQFQWTNIKPDATTSGSIAAIKPFRGVINYIMVKDSDDQGVEMDVLFLSSLTSLGTEGATPTITDANFDSEVFGQINLATWRDYTNLQAADKSDFVIPFDLKGDSMYVGIITRGAPTYTAAGLQLDLGISLED